MKINPENIDKIKIKFAKMQTKEELVSLLNEVKDIFYSQKSKPINLKLLNYYAYPEICKNRYKTFFINKKTGGLRRINAPVKNLKIILKVLNYILLNSFEPHKAAIGFSYNKSVKDNAELHVGKKFLYNIDLEDFFHSFDLNKVKMGLYNEVFHKNKSKEELAFFIASLTTHPLSINGEVKKVLPQGSPTSPILTNILCKGLDIKLSGLAKRFGAQYSRYADDITFSSGVDIFCKEDFQKELVRIIEIERKLKINPSKTRLQIAGFRQEVTGLIVNEKVNVRRNYVKDIRMHLYFCEKYGINKAERIIAKINKAKCLNPKNTQPNLKKVIQGKLEFLRMVKGDHDDTYIKLKKRFDKTNNSKTTYANQINFDNELEKFVTEHYKYINN